MADKIESLYSISKIDSLRAYSKKEIAQKLKEAEEASLEYKNEKARFLSQYPNPQNLTFDESLRQLNGEEIVKPSLSQPQQNQNLPEEDSEEGFVISINAGR